MGEGMCQKCGAIKMAVIGLIFVVNHLLLQYFGNGLNWWFLVGLLLLVGGIVKMIKPSCGCSERGSSMRSANGGKGKKR